MREAVLGDLRDGFAVYRDVVGLLPAAALGESLVLDLLEHETQHQGQLIRYVSDLGYTFPASWARGWNL